MNDDHNVVSLHPDGPTAALPPSPHEAKSLEQLIIFCERVEEALVHVTTALVGLESRMRRLELSWAKAEKQKLQSAAIYNGQGDRVR